MDSYTLLSAVSLSEDVSRLHTRSLGTHPWHTWYRRAGPRVAVGPTVEV